MLCPICSQHFQGDQPAFEFHVNHCLDAPPVASTSKLSDSEDTCPSCFSTWSDLAGPEHERESHIHACLLSLQDSQDAPIVKPDMGVNDNCCPICYKELKDMDSLFLHTERCLSGTREGENEQWAGLNEGDMEDGFDLYTNETGTKGKALVQGVAGLFPILVALLEKANSSSAHGGSAAVLCSAWTLHTSVRFGEYGYGFSCGYLVSLCSRGDS